MSFSGGVELMSFPMGRRHDQAGPTASELRQSSD